MTNRFRHKHSQMSDHILRVRLSKLTKDWQRHLDQIEDIEDEVNAINHEIARRGPMQLIDNRSSK